jgi:hypothetical protein
VFILAGDEKHQQERTKLNRELIGHLGTWEVERSPRGVVRPDWFQDLTMDDIEQMAKVMPGGRKA